MALNPQIAASMRTTDASAPSSTGQSETPAGSSGASASASCATDSSLGNSGAAYRAAREGGDNEADNDDGKRRGAERACAERRYAQIRIIEGETGKNADGDGPQWANAVAHAREQQRQDRHRRSDNESGRCKRNPR